MMKAVDEPNAKRRGWLKNGNHPGDPSLAPRCEAKTRSGLRCMAPAMKNGRCRMHGGKSTGPKTSGGLNNSRNANRKHGSYSRQVILERQTLRTLLAELHKV